MAKWIYDGLEKEVHVFSAKDEINHPISIGRSEYWLIIPNDAKYEGM